MKILCIGDIVSRTGREMLFKYLDDIKYSKSIDLVIANGENATHGRGLARAAYNELMRAGVDGVTLGNHAWGSKEVVPIMRREGNVIRPANFHRSAPGSGSMVLTSKLGVKVGVINLIGRTYLDPSNSPFDIVLEEIEKLKKSTNIILIDFHAEATSEKQALGQYLDGKVSAVFGTHTHVQTADDMILPNGTGFICDLGMTGAVDSVLGMSSKIIIDRFLTGMPQKFEIAVGRGQFCGCIFEIDEESGKCIGTERIFIREELQN